MCAGHVRKRVLSAVGTVVRDRGTRWPKVQGPPHEANVAWAPYGTLVLAIRNSSPGVSVFGADERGLGWGG